MDDEQYIRQSIELARNAIGAGNTPFGALLVIDNEVLKTDENTTITERDFTAHPEFKLARWAGMELDDEERAACTMYTSTEPCAMCGTAILYAGLGRVVFSVSGALLTDIRGYGKLDISLAEVIERGDGSTEVIGGVLEEEGRTVHEEYWD